MTHPTVHAPQILEAMEHGGTMQPAMSHGKQAKAQR
jgi:hypothetical protein